MPAPPGVRTPPPASSPTPTGSPTRARTRWATSVQMAGLAVQNFVSAAVGIAVAIALVRGFARSRTDRLGNFWVDLDPDQPAGPAADLDRVRGRVRRRRDDPELPPLPRRSSTLAGGTPDPHRRPVRQPGGDQGARHQRRRFSFNANSAHPVREPDRLDELAGDLPAAVHLVLAAAHVRPAGRQQAAGLRDRRGDGAARALSVRRLEPRRAECAPRHRPDRGRARPREGTETRFGVADSAVFATATTLTSTGAVDSFHDSYTSLGGGHAAAEHDARRGRARRHRFGPVRHAGPGRAVGVRRRADGRADTGVPGQEARRPGGEVRLAVPAHHAGHRAGRHRAGDGAAR